MGGSQAPQAPGAKGKRPAGSTVCLAPASTSGRQGRAGEGPSCAVLCPGAGRGRNSLSPGPAVSACFPSVPGGRLHLPPRRVGQQSESWVEAPAQPAAPRVGAPDFCLHPGGPPAARGPTRQTHRPGARKPSPAGAAAGPAPAPGCAANSGPGPAVEPGARARVLSAQLPALVPVPAP